MKKLPFIIFLDVDGVFNCQTFYKERRALNLKDNSYSKNETMEEYHQSQFCRDRVSWFNDLVKEIDATVVVSSSWRNHGVEGLQKIFDSVGGTFKVYDITPYGGKMSCRGDEIRHWLKENITKEKYGVNYYDFYKYAIIDDDSDMLYNQRHNLFLTDNYSGLTPNTCYKIKRFATHQTF